MRRNLLYPMVLIAALGLAACGQSNTAEGPSAEAPQAAAVEPDADPKFIGAPNSQWQTAGDSIRDDTLVRDVTFLAEDRGAMIEAVVQPTDATVRVQLINNEGVVLSEATAAAGQDATVSGQATGGNRNMVRVIRETRTSAPTPFRVLIRTVPERN